MTKLTATLIAASIFASQVAAYEPPLVYGEVTALQVAAYEPPLVYGDVDVTFYCACSKCCGKWAYNRPKDENGKPIVYGASGNVLEPMKSAACDASVPFGTKFDIDLDNGETLKVTCADRGGAVSGAHIDVYVGSDKNAHKRALKYGKRKGVAYVIAKKRV